MSRISLLLVLFLTVAGCSTFNREWKAAGTGPSSVDEIQGRWQGTWLSQTNGHQGRLRCILSRQTDGQYLAQFHANYRRILSFSYSVPLAVRQTNGVHQFRGDADLGRLAGGLYHYEGRATPTNFFSTYQSKNDGGVFQMRRR